ncbi:MAG: DUF1800 domain-containing protein [Bacteroidota bacterium]
MNTQTKIQHFYWRAGFGRSPQEWKIQEHYTLQQAIDQFFGQADQAEALPDKNVYKNASASGEKMTKEDKRQFMKMARKMVMVQNKEWVERMADPQQSALLEKMTLFWHGHFACITKMPNLAYRQIRAIRQHALGNFRDLVLAMAKDVSMIRFLNNQQNRKQKPNENFARELMELFTIGRGNYTETDIKEAARAFTGWSSNFRGTFKFKTRHHDFGEKTFMGRTGKLGGEEIIDILLEQRETAEFICRKVYRYFVNENVAEDRVRELADQFYRSNYDIRALMYTVFTSDWFYAPQNIGAKIKSPVELMAGMMRTLGVQFKKPAGVLFAQRALGQVLFAPPNVAGWPGGQAWIDNSTLMLRLNLANYLFLATDVPFAVKPEFEAEAQKRGKALRKLDASLDLQPLLALYQNQAPPAIFEAMKNYLLMRSKNIDADLFRDFVQTTDRETYIKNLAVRMMSVPEYQLC